MNATIYTKSAAERLAFIGVCLQLGIPVGWEFSRLRARIAISSLDLSDVSNLDLLTPKISEFTRQLAAVPTALMVGVALAVVGVLLFLVALGKYRCRASWAFWFAVIYGPLFALIHPITIPFGLLLLGYALSRRLEFEGQRLTSLHRNRRKR